MVGEASIYRKGARVRGLLRFWTLRSQSNGFGQRGLGGLQVGCARERWAEKRGEREARQEHPKTENVRR